MYMWQVLVMFLFLGSAIAFAQESSKDGPAFEVVAVMKGCKYFVVEQGPNHSLVED